VVHAPKSTFGIKDSALRAEFSGKSLVCSEENVRNHLFALYAVELEDTWNAQSAVCVYGRKYEVSGLGRSIHELCSFCVSNFTDEDYVGVLPKKSAEAIAKAKARIDLGVNDAFKNMLYGVLQR